MTEQMMTRTEIVRRLRFAVSDRVRHRPLTMAAIAARSGLSRVAVYDALHGIMGSEVQYLLSQILREVPVQELIERSARFRAGPATWLTSNGPDRNAPWRNHKLVYGPLTSTGHARSRKGAPP
jgi:hypothetical protein